MKRSRSGQERSRPHLLLIGAFVLLGFTLASNDVVEVGANDFRISDSGADGDINSDATEPDGAYNPIDNEYLVVWHAHPDGADNDREIFGQRIDAATGLELGTNDFHISDMGGGPSLGLEAFKPRVVYNSTEHEYLVVWAGEDVTNGEFEIYGQRLNASTGAEIGTDFRISAMGTDGDADADASEPAVAYNSQANTYLVVWQGDAPATTDNAQEIYGQRLDEEGAEIGADDFRISDMGVSDTNADADAFLPDVAYNGTQGEFLVIWRGDDAAGDQLDNEFEVYGQRLNAATGAEIGTDLRISDMGTDGNPAGGVGGFINGPAIAYNADADEYLVVWEGDDSPGLTADGEQEIFGQLLDGTGGEIGANDFQISDVGPDADPDFDAFDVGLTYASDAGVYLAVWRSDDNVGGRVEGEEEVHGQALDRSGAETGPDDFRISDVAGTGDVDRDATFPRAVQAPGTGEILVLWNADDSDVGTPPLGDGEFEVFGQRLLAGQLAFFIAGVPEGPGDDDHRVAAPAFRPPGGGSR